MPPAVFTLWAILLVVTVLVLPVIVMLLHRTWKAARRIERYFSDMLTAGLGVAGNTGHITALNDTIAVASGILEVAGSIDQHAATIETTLGGRAAGADEPPKTNDHG